MPLPNQHGTGRQPPCDLRVNDSELSCKPAPGTMRSACRVGQLPESLMPTLPRCFLRAVFVAALLPMAACAPDRDQFAPVCPGVAFLTPTADLTVFRPGSSGRDLTDLMLAGRMQGIQGKCEPGKDKNSVDAVVAVGAILTRGPAMRGNQVNVPVYVAVTEGDRILDKRVYGLTATFPSNVDRVSVATPNVFMVLPVSPTKSAAAYSILAGFQLTPDQLATGRSR
jgi:hypothetical protein